MLSLSNIYQTFRIGNQHLTTTQRFAMVTAPDARPYLRMIIERLFATLPVLSHVEIAKGVEVKVLGAIS